MDKDVDGHKVRDRIDWLINNTRQSEQEACSSGKIMLQCGVYKTCIIVLCSQYKLIAISRHLLLKFVVMNSRAYVAVNAALANVLELDPGVAALRVPVLF